MAKNQSRYSPAHWLPSSSLTSHIPWEQDLKNFVRAGRPKVWHQLADTPVALSTCVSLQGQLLAVGGEDSSHKATTAVHMYNTTTNSWEVISHMANPRWLCLVLVLPHNELMVVGGAQFWNSTDTVEIATIV